MSTLFTMFVLIPFPRPSICTYNHMHARECVCVCAHASMCAHVLVPICAGAFKYRRTHARGVFGAPFSKGVV